MSLSLSFSLCYTHTHTYKQVILGLPYSMAIDMWSLGCILAELYTGYPLFPGENEVEQLACIMEIFSLPDPSLLVEAQRKKLFFGECSTPDFLDAAGCKIFWSEIFLDFHK